MEKPEIDLAGKTVIITGGAGAIGAAVAHGFASRGANVAIFDIDLKRAEAAAGALSEGRHRGWAVDLRVVEGFEAAVAAVEDALGPVSVLVNAAGYLNRNFDLFAITGEEWDLQHAINLKATFFMCQTVARRMAAAQRPGSLINYTSQGWMSGGYSGSVVYNAAKGGVTTVTRGLARALAPHAIRVNAIAPGLVDTPMLRDGDPTEETVAEWRRSIPLGRLGTPEDHVGATLFLASSLSAYMTGATMNVTGGFLMY